MDIPQIIIAIDGYSATGKSSFANRSADRLGFLHLDSGALYRAVTLAAIENGLIDEAGNIDVEELGGVLENLEVTLRPRTFIGERDVEERIRQMDVSAVVSKVSSLAFVRTFVDGILREYGRKGGIVMDGRDIGSNVFPDAQLKIFMVASDEVRTRRRMEEYARSGKTVAFEEVLENLRERDYIDSHREISPLLKCEDALVLDNSEMSFEDQMEWLAAILRERFMIEI